MNHRIIARLDIKGPNLVKGINLEGLRVLGKPNDFAKHYYENGADELFYQDIVASLYERNSLKELISRTAKDIFIPLTVGGGLRTLDDIRGVLRAGADKVSLNTAILKDPSLLAKASKVFGSSTIVAAIESIKQPDGKYLVYHDNGREYTGVEMVTWAKKVEELGAGEILLTSVDQDGTGLGLDLEMILLVSESVSIPVIAHGGAGTRKHVEEAIRISKADAVALASIIHYGYLNRDSLADNYQDEGNIEFLKRGHSFMKFGIESLTSIKRHLVAKNIACRL